MASYTEHLNLLKKNPATDGADTFNIETMLNQNWDKIDEAVAKKAELGADGKVSAEQLPEMNYDKAGSAAAVQKNLDAHTGNRSNPHGVTASQVGARADTWVPSWGEVSGKPGTFPPSGHNHDASNIVSGILPVGRGGTGVTSLSALAAQLAANGGCRIATGSYVGDGNDDRELIVQFPWLPKWFVLVGQTYANSSSSLGITYGAPPQAGNANAQSQVYIPYLPTSKPTISSNNWVFYSFGYQTIAWMEGNSFHCRSRNGDYYPNSAGTTYYWVALG